MLKVMLHAFDLTGTKTEFLNSLWLGKEALKLEFSRFAKRS